MTPAPTKSVTRYRPEARNPVYHFAWGVRFFFAGLGLLVRKPALLGLSLVPILVTLLLLVGFAVGAAWLVGGLIEDWLDAELRAAAQGLVFVLTLLVSYFAYLPLARVILAPFSEAISRKAHTLNTGAPYANNQNWARSFREGLKMAALHLVIGASALVAGLAFPPVGAPLGIAVAVLLCALDFFDIPLSARGWRLGAKLGVLVGNKMLALGFGLAAYALLLVPVVNLLSIPVAVIGATLLIDALEEAG